MSFFTLAVDFDDTVVINNFPQIGSDIPGAESWLYRLCHLEGFKIILWTCRSGTLLKPAIDWFDKRNIPLYGINQNPDSRGYDSPKVKADVYIDDKNVCIPKRIWEEKINNTTVVYHCIPDWEIIGQSILKMAKNGE